MVSSIIEPKRGADVGRVSVEVRVQNLEDVHKSERGELPSEQIRTVVVQALVDSGATFFCIPEPLIHQLGLPFNRVRETRTITGTMTMSIYGGARIDVQGRSCDVEVMALPEGRQALLGQIPLETLDYWIDLTNQRLVGNPEHGGQWMAEAY